MTRMQHIWDVIVRSVKTGLAVYAAFLAAGGFNLVHVSGTIEARIVYLATLATAILNLGLKAQASIDNQVNPQSTPLVGQSPPETPPPSPVV